MKDTVEKYIRLREKANHRYRSWEHCFRAFNNTNDIDYLSLHLAFYLASWGMLRGSSLLLQKDYKIHIPIVKIILSKEGQSLKKTWIDQSDIHSIANLLEELRKEYAAADVSPTDTLLTKVLLGTLGCTPAFDRNFKKGWNDIVGRDLSIENVVDFASSHRKQIEDIKIDGDIIYPPMKIIDMYFWQHGYDMGKST